MLASVAQTGARSVRHGKAAVSFHAGIMQGADRRGALTVLNALTASNAEVSHVLFQLAGLSDFGAGLWSRFQVHLRLARVDVS